MITLLVVFAAFLVAGRVMDEVSWRGVGVCLLLAAGAFVACAVFRWNIAIFMTCLGLLDVFLVIAVFKGDVRIRCPGGNDQLSK